MENSGVRQPALRMKMGGRGTGVGSESEWLQHAPGALNVEASSIFSHLQRRKSVQGFFTPHI